MKDNAIFIEAGAAVDKAMNAMRTADTAWDRCRAARARIASIGADTECEHAINAQMEASDAINEGRIEDAAAARDAAVRHAARANRWAIIAGRVYAREKQGGLRGMPMHLRRVDFTGGGVIH